MSVSRRGFLQGLKAGRTSHAAEFMAARGHEEHVAKLMQQGRQGGMNRPQLPPGVQAIRISSNENPLGPGKAAIDAILGKFPEANRYPFNSTPLDADLEMLDREDLQREARERRPRRRLAGAAEERRARLPVADQAPGHPVADLRRPGGVRAERAQGHGQDGAGHGQDAEDRSQRAAAARRGRGSRLHLQPEQPDGDDQQRPRRSTISSPRSRRRRRRPAS